MKDVNKLSVISQFIQLLNAGGERQGGMAGLNQFVTFLSKKDSMTRYDAVNLSFVIIFIIQIIIKAVSSWRN